MKFLAWMLPIFFAVGIALQQAQPQQQVFCPERNANDNSNACASTSYVDRAVAGAVPALPQNDIFVGNASGQAAAVAMSGDASIVSSGALTISPSAVTYSKIQNIAASRLLGNPTGAGAAPSEISLGATLAFSGSALQTGAGSGDVTWAANAFTTTIAANAVSNAKFRQSAALSVVGNSGSATANAADIAGTASQFLGVNSGGTALGFQTLGGDATLAGATMTIANNAVSNAKLATMTQNAVKGAASSTSVADLSVPSCSTGASALTWTTNTGFGCNTISGSSGTLISINVYSSTQTITIPTGATKAFIRLWGGSGGSGGASAAGNGGVGGTGAAGYLEKYLTGLTAGNTLAYTQGGAGAAGANTGTAGGNGGASSLASGTQTITTLTANGSNGSAGLTSATNTLGTAGGTATNGDINITGASGQDGFYGLFPTSNNNSNASMGGHSLFSPGANGIASLLTAAAGNAGYAGGMIIFWFS